MRINGKVILHLCDLEDVEKNILERMEKQLIIKRDYIMGLKNISYIVIGLGMIALFASVGLMLETKCTKDPNTQEFWNYYSGGY